MINCRKKFFSNSESKNFLSDDGRQRSSAGLGVEIFAAIAKEFPAIYHQRESFLCQALLLLYQKKSGVRGKSIKTGFEHFRFPEIEIVSLHKSKMTYFGRM